MPGSKKQLTKISKFLIYLAAFEDLIVPATNIYELRKRLFFGSSGSFESSVYKMYKRGWIKVVDKNAEKFIKITSKGQIEALIARAYLPNTQKWDGFWRMVIFDIPEQSRDKRDLLRELLKTNGFLKLQDSVYINPYPLNRDAIKYLGLSGLRNYIRIISIKEIDDDSDLRKHFKLKK
jgi:CRISPR-associated endonuclease Cas2